MHKFLLLIINLLDFITTLPKNKGQDYIRALSLVIFNCFIPRVVYNQFGYKIFHHSITEISMANNKKDDAAKQKEDNERAGTLAGVAGGALAGAQVGTVLMPIVGTFTGAVVGGVLGSKVGKKYGGALLDKLNSKAPSEAAPEDKKDVTAELERLAALHKKGVLTEDEFRAAKASLLGL